MPSESNRTLKSWWRSNSSSHAPTTSAPISSATKPAIATRPSVRVPLRLTSSANATSTPARMTVVVRVGVNSNSAPMNGTAPVDTLATVAISAQP